MAEPLPWRPFLREKRHDGTVLNIRIKGDDQELGNLAARFFRDDLPGLQTVRIHDWGGSVYRWQNEGGRVFYFKHIAPRSLRNAYKLARAQGSLRQEQAAHAAGFSVASAGAEGRITRLGITLQALLVYRAVQEEDSVFRLLNKPRPGCALDDRQKEQLAVNLGKELGRWHAANLFHGDLHLNNIWTSRAGGFSTFTWIDHEEGRRYASSLPHSRRLHDLVHVARGRYPLSPRNRLRMWKAYCRTAGLDRETARAMLRKISASAQRYQEGRGWKEDTEA